MSWETPSKRMGIVLLALAGCTGSPSMMTAPSMDLGGAPDLTSFADFAVRGDLAVAADDLASPGDLEPSALSFDPPSYDFGSLAVGSAATSAFFTLTNNTSVDSGPLTVGLIGTGASDFNIVSDSCNGNSLAASSTCSVEVQFYPSASGLRTVTLTVRGSPGESAESQLKGTGLSVAQLGIMPNPTFDFGPVASAAPSAEASFTVTNNGGSDSGPIDVTLTGTDVGEFVITSNACQGNTVAASASCTVKVTFNPSSLSAGSATLQVTGSPGGTAHVDLTGTGATASQLALTTSPTVSFAPQLDNTTSSEASVGVTNSGGAPTGAPASATLSGDDASFFAITQSCGSAPIAGGAGCTVEVTFTPNAPRTFNATLTISASPGGQVQVPLSGSGLGPASLVIGGDALTFDSVPIGSTSAPHFISVKNQGDVPTSSAVSASLTDSSQFLILVSTCNGVLDPGSSCDAKIVFHPSAPTGDKSTDLQFSSTGLTTQTAHLSGTAVNGSTLTISPASPFQYNGGSAMVSDGSTSKDQDFTVTNGGGATSGTIMAQLDSSPHYKIQSPCSKAQLTPGDSCTITVRFLPVQYSTGEEDSSLTLTENGNSVIEVLEGSATSPAHLQWVLATIDFGKQHVGTAGATYQIVLNNSGDQDATGLAFSILGTDSSQFIPDIPGLPNGECTSTLPKNSFCPTGLHFSPSPSSGGIKRATLEVTSTNADKADENLIGDAQWQITVSTSGNGTGYVTGSFGGASLSCGNGGACTLLIDDNQTVQLTAHPAISSTFNAFSGGCTGASPCTTSVIHGETSVGAEFDKKTYDVTLSKQHYGTTNAWGSLGENGVIVCDDGCSSTNKTYTYGANVSLVAVPDAGDAIYQWVGGPCDGSTNLTCRFTANDTSFPSSPTTIQAKFTPINKAFVSTWNPLGSAIGGIAAANTECGTLAKNAGLDGKVWKAWLSDSTTDAKNNFPATLHDNNVTATSRGWMRIDGQPLLDRLTDPLLSPIYQDENGTIPAVQVPVFTGTNADGTKNANLCGDWKSSSGNGEMGYSGKTGSDWTANKSTSCANQAHIYCLEDDYVAPLNLSELLTKKTSSAAKLAFLSTMTYNANNGISSLDQGCVTEAHSANLTNYASYIALVAPNGNTAASRLTTAFTGIWYRFDGVPLFDKTKLTNGSIPYSTLNVGPDGSYHSNLYTWTGATDTNVTGSATCTNWTSTSGTTNAGLVQDAFRFFTYGTSDSCGATDHHLYCVQN